jgi:putative membrane protein
VTRGRHLRPTVGGMNGLATVLALLQALTLVVVGVLEAFRYRDERWYSIFLIRPQDQEAVRLWVVNVGFYNILMGLACVVGVWLARWGDQEEAGRAIVIALSAMHVVLGIVLLVTERRLWRNSAGEAGLAAAVVLATALS